MSVLVELRCLACNHVQDRSFELIAVDPRPHEVDPSWDGVFIPQIVRCDSCGAEDAHVFDPPQLAELRRQAGRWRFLVRHMPREPAGVVEARCKLFDGTVSTRAGQSRAHLRELTQQDPENGEPWRRLGNFCEKLGLMEEAERAWREAVEADATEAEAAGALALLLFHRGDAEAARFLHEALNRFPSAAVEDDEQRFELAGGLVGLLERVVESTDDEGALEMAWHEPSAGPDPVVRISKVDLAKVDRWDRLTELLASGTVITLRLTPDLPEEEPTQLQVLLDSSAAGLTAVTVPIMTSPRSTGSRSPWALPRPQPAVSRVWRSSSKKPNKRGRTRG